MQVAVLEAGQSYYEGAGRVFASRHRRGLRLCDSFHVHDGR